MEVFVPNPLGYHSRKIEKGVLGLPSKIREEFEEFEDALVLDNPVMALLELADLIGAIEAYADTQFNVSLEDLIVMMNATKSAFLSGRRKSEPEQKMPFSPEWIEQNREEIVEYYNKAKGIEWRD